MSIPLGMDRIGLIKWMNKHHNISAYGLMVVGYLLHLLYEVLKHIHAGKPMTLAEFLWLAGLAAIVWIGAAVAGWAVDLKFTKNEEEAGEID